MIGFIKGILRDKDYDNITVECGGVGFNIMVTNSCMSNLPGLDEEVKIYTYLHVREDEMSLYGFESPEEKKLFLQLISVSGVGSKTAIGILSAERMSAIINSIINEDTSVIANCKGIGKKTAERIILELKDKIYQVCKDINDVDGYRRHLQSIGSLGGGNHFIEINKDKDGYIWLSVHCGSRNFGKKICEYHQNKAIKLYQKRKDEKREYMLSQIEPKDRQEWIRNHIDSEKLPEDLRYLDGEDLDLYVEHMKVAEEFATVNHKVIVDEICSHMNWTVVDSIFTHHNYIEFLGNREMIIRKGSISAKKDERVIIPLNMKDGSIIGVGKGNSQWNESAPHGAGRVLSRGKAKEILSVDEFQDKMKDVWSSCISENTLDESPMAYKDMNVIIDSIGETVDIIDRIIPIYNYKAN